MACWCVVVVGYVVAYFGDPEWFVGVVDVGALQDAADDGESGVDACVGEGGLDFFGVGVVANAINGVVVVGGVEVGK